MLLDPSVSVPLPKLMPPGPPIELTVWLKPFIASDAEEDDSVTDELDEKRLVAPADTRPFWMSVAPV